VGSLVFESLNNFFFVSTVSCIELRYCRGAEEHWRNFICPRLFSLWRF
jgi:hypothetical protein